MTAPSPMQAAIGLAAMGFQVFPVSANKHPRTPNGHKAASSDPDRIRAMGLEFGFVLVGVATGEASDLAVLDVDRQHGGEVWWLANRDRLPVTRVHRSRSGGLHLWFRHQPGLRCSNAKIAPGVDIKAQSGSIIYWPAAGFPILCDAPLAAWPKWLVPALKPLRASKPCEIGPRPTERIEASLLGIVRVVATAAPGSRNSRLFWGAARCAEMTARGELSRRHAEAALIEAAARAGLDAIESTQTISSAYRLATS